MRRRRFPASWLPAVTLLVVACGSSTGGARPPRGSAPDPSVLLPRLADPAFVYRDLGFFAKGEPLPFVASLRYLAGPMPDSTLAVFALSLANRALSFRRTAAAVEGRYRVEVVFRRGPSILRQLSSEQAVRVGSLGETRRADESVIFQHFFYLPPGSLTATVVVRDRNRLTSNRDEGEILVPRFGAGPQLSALIPIYQGTARATRAALPTILVNPRATSPQGSDTLAFYLEGYGLSSEMPVVVRAVRTDGGEAWRDTIRIEGAQVAAVVGGDTVRFGTPEIGAAIVRVGPNRLQLGELRFEATVPGQPDTLRTVALVTFSEQWAVTNLEDVLALLRYFGREQEIQQIRAAAPAERAGLWRAFWRRTDPDTTTPENEALIAYFRRIEIANIRFREESEPGWLTDRGEVYITLGEPDMVERSDDLRSNRTVIRWTYLFGGETVLLYFVNDLSLQRFRLTFSSRVEYQRMLSRVRQREGEGRPPN
ncbi:MAG: GWxTD domain-containing protein [Gemmatimonadetes bacterium]|nr:GWxTD domain-containing protein [Gemmatimonadota bacterium]